MKDTFDIQYWLHFNNTSCVSQTQTSKIKNLSASFGPDSVSHSNDTETVLSRLESTHTDITGSYHEWVKIGFAFAHEHGEAGRSYFHRVSRYYSKYEYSDCEKQYDRCLKDNGQGITIKTFFYMAEQVGIDIHCKDSTPTVVISAPSSQPPMVEKPAIESIAEIKENMPHIYDTPCLPTEVYNNLPDFLRTSCDLFKDGIEKDIFLTSALGVLSACFPNVEGYYFKKPLSAQLYLFIVVPSAAGKGSMEWSKYLGQTIHDLLIEQSFNERTAYELELEKYDNLPRAIKQTAEKPILPKRRMFFIPGNSSNSALTQALAENNNSGLIFENEADTMANTAKQDWGDSSDVYRKAFHHETVSLYRRKDNEYIEIKNPHVAIVMSGTPNQLKRILPDSENGLYSRYMFYAFEDNGGFNNPFESDSTVDYIAWFKKKGLEVSEFYQHLQNRTQSIVFNLTVDQQKRFTNYFNVMLHKNRVLVGHDFDASVKRMGIMHFRISMILTVLRMFEDGDVTNELTCSDQDFETALTIVTTLEKHAIAIYNNMDNNGLKGVKLAFYEKLPQKFDRQCYLKVAESLGIQPKSAEHYITQFKQKLIGHDGHNEYTKKTN